MKRTAAGVLVIILLAGIVVFTLVHHSTTTSQTVSATNTRIDLTADGHLSTTTPNCIAYYNDSGIGTDTISTELTDFTNLHPLSDFLCGTNTEQQTKVQLTDGKTLHFIAPVSAVNCGADGTCTYFPMLEEQPGLVRRIRGFTWYSDAGSASTVSVSQDTSGELDGVWKISSPKRNTIAVYDLSDPANNCGITNTYTFTATDTPVVISASDSCLPGKGILYPMK